MERPALIDNSVQVRELLYEYFCLICSVSQVHSKAVMQEKLYIGYRLYSTCHYVISNWNFPHFKNGGMMSGWFVALHTAQSSLAAHWSTDFYYKHKQQMCWRNLKIYAAYFD